MYSIALLCYFRNRYNASDLNIVFKNSHFRYSTICGLKKEMFIQICVQRDFSFRLCHLVANYDHSKKKETYEISCKSQEYVFAFCFFKEKNISHIHCENEKKWIVSVSRNFLRFHFRVVSEREARAHLSPPHT